MSNRALPLCAAAPRRRRTERHLSRVLLLRFNLTEHLARYSVGVSERVEGEDDSLENCKEESRGGTRVGAIGEERWGRARARPRKKEERERERGEFEHSRTSCLVDTMYDPRNRYLSP